jgi:hypothetical protein
MSYFEQIVALGFILHFYDVQLFLYFLSIDVYFVFNLCLVQFVSSENQRGEQGTFAAAGISDQDDEIGTVSLV